MRLMIGHLGYARSTPHAILYGPKRYGGANLRPPYDEQGTAQMLLALKHLRTPGMISSLPRSARMYMATSSSYLYRPNR